MQADCRVRIGGAFQHGADQARLERGEETHRLDRGLAALPQQLRLAVGEKQALVFHEFTRLDPGAAAGSGIGLAISRRVARALGGEITFARTPGVGSTFTLWLPFEPPPTPPQEHPAARAEA